MQIYGHEAERYRVRTGGMSIQEVWYRAKERDEESGQHIKNSKETLLTKGVSFGPQISASQVKKSSSEIGPGYPHTPYILRKPSPQSPSAIVISKVTHQQ